MNIQVDPTRSNLASAMLNSKIRPRAVVGYGVKIFLPSPPNYVTRSPGPYILLNFCGKNDVIGLAPNGCVQNSGADPGLPEGVP